MRRPVGRFPVRAIIEAFRARPGASLAAGALLPFGLAPYDLWPLTLVSAAGLYWVLTRDGARPLRDGWLFGVGKYGLGASWIYVSIHEYGGRGAAAGGIPRRRVRRRHGAVSRRRRVALRPLSPGECDRFRDMVRNGLGAAGMASHLVSHRIPVAVRRVTRMLDTPLEALAPVGGVLLVSFAAVLTAACLVAWRKWTSWAVASLPWIAAWLVAGASWTEPGTAHRVALVQGDIPQEIKWQPDAEKTTFERYASLSAPFWDRDLVIWPEGVFYASTGAAGSFLSAMSERRRRGSRARRCHPRGRDRRREVLQRRACHRRRRRRLQGNSVWHRSVTSCLFRRFCAGLIGFFDLPMSTLSPGESGQPPLGGGNGLMLGMAICYEIAYPDLVRHRGKGADALVTLSNDTWFGESIGPLQHMQIARMRALENGRYVLRATNNGVTAIIDGRGRVTAALPQFERGVLSGAFRRTAGDTPFGRFGSILVIAPLILFLVAVIGGSVAARFSSSRNAP